MTNQEVEQIKGHFDKVAHELRSELSTEVRGEFALVRSEIGEFRLDAAVVADHLKQEITEVRHYTGAVAEDLRSDIRAVAEGVGLANQRIDDVDLNVDGLTGRMDGLTTRVDGLTGEVRRGFAGVRAEIHRLHETDDELRRRIEAQEQRGA